ncbi:hypothetical protein BDW59DRAFT_160921 [Aspergillus cavernicola]|uniref:Methyltransferase domain-containing protein n=1 Tax=Aspergillus cavernicola TaxID=176166 RepID=A0ABR4IF46_9EURO
MDGLDYKFQSVIDIGWGSGERLMQILSQYPGTTGIGIDPAGPSIKVAADEALERGFGNRLSLRGYHADFAQVELLTMPIFPLGLEFGHAMIGVYLPMIEEGKAGLNHYQ